jgi:hypothetical protein
VWLAIETLLVRLKLHPPTRCTALSSDSTTEENRSTGRLGPLLHELAATS